MLRKFRISRKTSGHLISRNYFHFQVDEDFAKCSLDGTVTYKSGGRERRMDFSLEISTLDLLAPMKEGLTDLLSQGALRASTTKKKTLREMKKFKHVMRAVGKKSGFAVAEQVEDSAYLSAKFLNRYPVALLLKMSDGKLVVDGKSVEQIGFDKGNEGSVRHSGLTVNDIKFQPDVRRRPEKRAFPTIPNCTSCSRLFIDHIGRRWQPLIVTRPVLHFKIL